MRCEDIAVELDAYSTGELDAETRTLMEQHIRQCSSCREELLKVQKENALYRDYASAASDSAHAKGSFHPRGAEPLRWREPAISRSISRSFPGWIWVAAAIIVMAIGLSWFFYAHRSAPLLVDNAISGQPRGAEVSMDQALRDLEHAVTLLQNSYSEKKPQLDPKLVSELDRNLAITREAIRECKQALKKNPANNQAVEFLMLDYQKQIDVLKQISEGL